MNDKINLDKEYINAKFLIINKMISNIEFNNSKTNNLFILEKIENLIFDLIDFYNNKKDTLKFNSIEIKNVFEYNTPLLIKLIEQTLSTYLIRTDIQDNRKSDLIDKLFNTLFQEQNTNLIENISKSLFTTTTFNTRIKYLSLKVHLIKIINKEMENNNVIMNFCLSNMKKYLEEEISNFDICFAQVSIAKSENKELVSKPYFKIYKTLINNFLISLSEKEKISTTDEKHLEYIINIEEKMLSNTDSYYKYGIDYEALLFDKNNNFKVLNNRIMESIKKITLEKIKIIEQEKTTNNFKYENLKEEMEIIQEELLKLKLFLLKAFSIVKTSPKSLQRCSEEDFISKFISNENNLTTKSTIDLLSSVIKRNFLYNDSIVKHNRTNNKTLFSSFFQISNFYDENIYRILYGEDFVTKEQLIENQKEIFFNIEISKNFLYLNEDIFDILKKNNILSKELNINVFLKKKFSITDNEKIEKIMKYFFEETNNQDMLKIKILIGLNILNNPYLYNNLFLNNDIKSKLFIKKLCEYYNSIDNIKKKENAYDLYNLSEQYNKNIFYFIKKDSNFNYEKDLLMGFEVSLRDDLLTNIKNFIDTVNIDLFSFDLLIPEKEIFFNNMNSIINNPIDALRKKSKPKEYLNNFISDEVKYSSLLNDYDTKMKELFEDIIIYNKYFPTKDKIKKINEKVKEIIGIVDTIKKSNVLKMNF